MGVMMMPPSSSAAASVYRDPRDAIIEQLRDENLALKEKLGQANLWRDLLMERIQELRRELVLAGVKHHAPQVVFLLMLGFFVLTILTIGQATNSSGQIIDTVVESNSVVSSLDQAWQRNWLLETLAPPPLPCPRERTCCP